MPVVLATDIIVYLLFAAIGAFALSVRRPKSYGRGVWTQLKQNRLAVVCMAILLVYASIALLDSIRWRSALTDDLGKPALTADGDKIYAARALSLLDRALTGLREANEKTFSAPFAETLYVKETIETPTGDSIRDYPKLKYPGRHWLGTDKVGSDVLFAALKGVRTGIVIGTGTTIIVIPFAVLFGVLAGYFGGRVDDVIQYVYTTLASVPDILLIVAFMLIFGAGGYQGGVVKESDTFLGFFIINDRLFWLCAIMGITSWTGLCRIIRGETLKLRELEYVEAARAFAVPRMRIIYRHVVPNVMHLALITMVLQFSGLVLAEAILSYLGIGVGSEMGSWGNMINNARLELSREPVVWWSLLGAFVFMFALVLPANIFGDAVRDALDPRLRTARK